MEPGHDRPPPIARVAEALCELGAWGCWGYLDDGGTRLVYDLTREDRPDLTTDDLADLMEMAGITFSYTARIDLVEGHLAPA